MVLLCIGSFEMDRRPFAVFGGDEANTDDAADGLQRRELFARGRSEAAGGKELAGQTRRPDGKTQHYVVHSAGLRLIQMPQNHLNAMGFRLLGDLRYGASIELIA